MSKNTIAARRVTLNQTVKVCEISSIYDYTASEISATYYYDEDEMDKITKRCFKILSKYESGKSKNSRKYCIRGLEGHSTLGSITKKSNRSAACTAVLDEQERHWNETEDIRFQAISDAYRQTSSSCQMWAQVVGNRDQRAVEGYLHDEDQDDVSYAKYQQAENVATKHTPRTQKSNDDVERNGSRIASMLSSPPASPFDPGARAA